MSAILCTVTYHGKKKHNKAQTWQVKGTPIPVYFSTEKKIVTIYYVVTLFIYHEKCLAG